MICAIVLAAGESRRMGTQKLLLPFGSTTVVGHIVGQLLNSAVDKAFVVTGHDADTVAGALAALRARITIVHNPEYRSGMLSSVRCGLRALPPEARGVLIALGDQPAINASLVNDLIQAFAKRAKGIVVPAYEGRRGHPLLFATRYSDEILTLYGDTGLRGLLHAHPDDVLEVSASTPAVVSDMDFPEDYRREIEEQQHKSPH